jgi:hypothetical protein
MHGPMEVRVHSTWRLGGLNHVSRLDELNEARSTKAAVISDVAGPMKLSAVRRTQETAALLDS